MRTRTIQVQLLRGVTRVPKIVSHVLCSTKDTESQTINQDFEPKFCNASLAIFQLMTITIHMYSLRPKSNATFYILKHDLECLLGLSS